MGAGKREGGGRREGGRKREEGGKSKQGGKKEGLLGAPGGPWGLLGSSPAVSWGSWVLLWGSRSVPGELLRAAWEFLGCLPGLLGGLWGL